MHKTRLFTGVWSVWVAGLLVLPAMVVIPLSFAERKSFRFPPTDLSLKWYANIFSDPRWFSSIVDSLVVALLTTVICTILGTLAAIAIRWSGSKVLSVIHLFLLSPMIVPLIISAVAIYGVFLRWHLNNTLWGFVLGHSVLAIPFVIVAVDTSLRSYDMTLNKASASLGASPFATFARVTMPLIAPGIASGAGFAFITSFDEVVLALFLQGPSIKTLPVKMWASIAQETDPTLSAVASVLVLASTAIILLSTLRSDRKTKR